MLCRSCRPPLGPPLALLAALLAIGSAPARAAELVFVVDPARSTIAIAAGSQSVVPLPQNFSGIGFGNRTLAHLAPAGGTPRTLPDGTTSDGLRTALRGALRTDFADPPTQLQIVRDATTLALAPSGSWLPGLPTLPAVPADAGLALRFADPALDWSWSAALRDWTLSLSTEDAAATLAPAGADRWSFAAGCTPPATGCPVFRVEEAAIDSADARGFLARNGFRSGRDVLANPPAAQGTLERLPGDRWQLTVPIAFTLAIDGHELYDPLGIDHAVVFSGQIVAVPEPAGGAPALASLLALAVLAARRARTPRRARTRRRAREAAVAAALLALAPALGCYSDFDPTLNKTSFLAPIRCTNEWLRGYEIVGGNEIPIGEFQNPVCNANGITVNGTISGGVPFQAINNAYAEYGERGLRLVVGSTWDLSGDSSIPVKIDYRARFEIDYQAATIDRPNPPQLYWYAWDYGLGTTAGSSQSGTISVNGVASGSDWQVRTSVLNGAGGTAFVDLQLEAFRSGAGKEYQGVLTWLGVRPNRAKTNLDCKRLLGDALPFRARTAEGDVFCSPGAVGFPCSHSAQCGSGNECYDGACRKRPYSFEYRFRF